MFEKFKNVLFSIGKGAQITSSTVVLISDFNKYKESDPDAKKVEIMIMKYQSIFDDAVAYMKRVADCGDLPDDMIFNAWVEIQSKQLQEDIHYIKTMLDVDEVLMEI